MNGKLDGQTVFKSPDNRVWITVHGAAPIGLDDILWLRTLAREPDRIDRELGRNGGDGAAKDSGDAARRRT